MTNMIKIQLFICYFVLTFYSCVDKTSKFRKYRQNFKIEVENKYPFLELVSFGTFEMMAPKTEKFSIDFNLTIQDFKKVTLDSIADQSATKTFYELLPSHHLYQQLTNITVDFRTETIPIDTVENFIIYRTIYVESKYDFKDKAHFKKVLSKIDTITFEKLLP